MMPHASAPYALRLMLDSQALRANFRWFQDKAGVPAIPAVKADGYGLGAREVVRELQAEGAKEFAVATWQEAEALGRADLPLLILHGFTASANKVAADFPLARPVLNTPAQCAAWKAAFPGRAADIMMETGMNRLGLLRDELSAADGIAVDIVHSHLACADEPGHPLTHAQLLNFREIVAATPGRRHALANSAGICTGRDYSFDCVRPGLGLFGGVPHPDAQTQRVLTPEAQVIQISQVLPGETVGYGATWTADKPSRIAVLNCGYADGIVRRLSPGLIAMHGEQIFPSAGRISMDMTAFDVTGSDVAEGDWLTLDWDLAGLERLHGTSQYELLTRLSARFQRVWF